MQYNKRSFFQEIMTLVFLSHLFLLAIVFLCDFGTLTPERFVIQTQKTQATIVFVPLKKRVAQEPVSLSAQQKKSNTRKIIDYDKYQKKLAKQLKKQKKAVIKKQIQSTQTQPVIQKKSTKVVPPVKKAVTSIQAEVVKKVELKKNIVQPKEMKKIEPKKKVITPAPKIVPPVKKIIEPVQQITVQEQQAPQLLTPDSNDLTDEKNPVINSVVTPVDDVHDASDIDLDNVTFVGSNDLEMLEIQEQIKLQVAQHYKPPVGISKKAVCELMVLVGMDGKVQRVTVKKSSGSMANDMCARAALLKIMLPQKMFGKEIIVELGQ